MSDRRLSIDVVLDTIDKATAPLKKIMGGSKQTADALRESKNQLALLQRQQRDVSSFQQLQRATKQNRTELSQASETARRLKQQLDNTTNPSRKLTREFERAQQKVSSLRQTQIKHLSTMKRAKAELEAAGIDVRNLSQHNFKLSQDIDTATAAMQRQQKALDRLTQRQQRSRALSESAMGLAGRGTAAFASGSLGLMSMGNMMSPVVQAQSSGSLIAARQGQGGDSAQGYTQIINALKADGNMAVLEDIAHPLDATAAAFGRLGNTSSAELQRITRHALNLSSTFGTDTTESIQMAQIMLKNGLATSADQAFDLITGGLQNVTAEMRGELPEILHEYSTNFRGMGFSGQETMNLLIKMAQQGKFALDKTGDAIKEFSIRGSDMSKTSVEAYQAIGLNAANMSKQIARGGDDAQQALQKTVKGLLQISDPAERANTAIALFGTPLEDLAIDQIPDFLKALGGVDDVLGNTTGAADRLGKQLHDNLSGDLGKLSGSWSELKSELFGGESGALRDLAQQLTGTIKLISNWARENPELAATLVKVAAILAVVLTTLGALGLAASSAMLGFSYLLRIAPLMNLFSGFSGVLMTLGKSALPIVTQAVLWLGRALMANPIGIAVGLIAAAAYLIYKNWEPIKAFFMGLWTQVKTAFDGGLAGIGQLLLNWSPIGLIYSAIRSGLAALGIELPAQFADFGGHMIDGMISGITNKLGALKESITGAAGAASDWFKEKLGIHSPSRVFASHGSDVMAGLQKGLGDNSGVLKPVDQISQQLKAAGAGMTLSPQGSPLPLDKRAPLQATRTASQNGAINGPIEIHIHAAAGMDEAKLAQLVEQKLRQLQSGQAAAQRSNLSDED